MNHNIENLPELELVNIESKSENQKLFELYQKIKTLKIELDSAREINNLLSELNGRFQK